MDADSILTLSSAAIECLVCFFMLQKSAWRRFPIFLAYVFWSLASDLAAFYMQHYADSHFYFKLYIVETIIESILQFGVLVELGWSVLRPVRASLPKATIYIVALLVALAGLAIWPLAGKTIPAGYYKWSLLLFHLQQTFAILRIVCFLAMAAFSQLFAIGWRDRELQIATGLGFYSIISLVVTMFHSQQTGNVDDWHILDQAVSFGYLGTLAYWVLSFATQEQKRKEFSPQMQHLLLQLGGGARAGRIALSNLPSKPSRNKD